MSQQRAQQLIVRQLGVCEFQPIWDRMRDFAAKRSADSADEIWLLEHPPIYTLGLNGKSEHVLNPGDIPVLACDRGGQVTYHGPGQLIAYLLLDLKRLNLGVKALVSDIEQAVINLLAQFDVQAQRKEGAPGVYVEGAKIAALGLRVKSLCTYHGLSLNIDMDLAPFQGINPCGMAGLQSTQLSDCVVVNQQLVRQRLVEQLIGQIYQQRGLGVHLVWETDRNDAIASDVIANAPSWVAWVAQDADGAWWGFEVEPLLHDHGWYENEVGRYVRLGSSEMGIGWRDSVRRINVVN